MSRIERVESADGTVIACHVAGDGPPLVLVHGTTADHTRWSRVIDRLTARFTTYAIDRRGRGASADGGDYSIEREFDDVTAVVESIAGDADLLGHSYGAVCALEATVRAPRARRLVLYEPPLPLGWEMYPPGTVERLEELLAAGEREAVVATFLRDVVRVSEGDLDLMRSQAGWAARVEAAHTIPRELGVDRRYVPDFERIATLRVPTLLLAGGASPPFLAEPTRRLHASIPGARLEVMDGQGHVAMDSAPELFLEHVVGFLGAA